MRDLDHILQELKRGLQDIYGSRLIALYLFGSQARGDAEEDSDVDVAMVLDDYEYASTEITRTGEIVAAISLENNCVVSCIPIREREWEERQTIFLRNVHREGAPVA